MDGFFIVMEWIGGVLGLFLSAFSQDLAGAVLFVSCERLVNEE
jgi:hypothetical protein